MTRHGEVDPARRGVRRRLGGRPRHEPGRCRDGPATVDAGGQVPRSPARTAASWMLSRTTSARIPASRRRRQPRRDLGGTPRGEPETEMTQRKRGMRCPRRTYRLQIRRSPSTLDAARELLPYLDDRSGSDWVYLSPILDGGAGHRDHGYDVTDPIRRRPGPRRRGRPSRGCRPRRTAGTAWASSSTSSPTTWVWRARRPERLVVGRCSRTAATRGYATLLRRRLGLAGRGRVLHTGPRRRRPARPAGADREPGAGRRRCSATTTTASRSPPARTRTTDDPQRGPRAPALPRW